jgi:hypothetical protein
MSKNRQTYARHILDVIERNLQPLTLSIRAMLGEAGEDRS